MKRDLLFFLLFFPAAMVDHPELETRIREGIYPSSVYKWRRGRKFFHAIWRKKKGRQKGDLWGYYGKYEKNFVWDVKVCRRHRTPSTLLTKETRKRITTFPGIPKKTIIQAKTQKSSPLSGDAAGFLGGTSEKFTERYLQNICPSQTKTKESNF